MSHREYAAKKRARLAGAIKPIYVDEGTRSTVFESKGFAYKVYNKYSYYMACAEFLCLGQLWDQFPEVRKHIPRIEFLDRDNVVLVKEFINGTVLNGMDYRIDDDPGQQAREQIKDAASQLGWLVIDMEYYRNVVFDGENWVIIDMSPIPDSDSTRQQLSECTAQLALPED